MKSKDPRFVPPSADIERRVTALIEALTLPEKIRLLGGKPGVGSTFGVPRLGIPELRLADGPLGVHWWCDASTAYPAAIAAAASFDPDLWYRFGRAIGRDCRARGVHILLAPGVNIYRSALCGRNFEYAGEDPYLSSRFGVAYVAGVQDTGVSATIKHYACNFQEYERHHVSSDVDARTLREVYLPAFHAAVTEAGCGALMTAYNLVNGVHCSEHPELILDILRGEWGFQGVVMSDWISTYSAVGAANAGLGLEMPEAEWLNEAKLAVAIERGEVSVATIDDKVRCLLRLAACFGWLDHEQQDASIPLDDPATAEVALELARAGIVLLRNEGGVLPLALEQTKKLAVLGFGAHPALISGGGSAYTPPHRSVSVLDGVRALAGDRVEVVHARGPDASPDLATYRASVFECDAGPGLWGEYFDNNELGGAPAASRLDPHVDFFWGKAKPAPEITVRQYSIRWTGAIRPTRSGKHVFYARCRNGHYRIRVGSQPIIDTWQRERNGMHQAELTLEAGQRYELSIEWRKTRVSGNMKFGWRFDDGQVPGLEECVALARTADAAVLCVGFDNVTESEGYDREFRMPDTLERLVAAVAAVQPRTLVVLTAGGNVHMGGWIDQVAALLHAWYPGQAGGQAIAEALFGRINPAGRLPASFERELADRSSFESYHDADGDLRVRLADGIFGGYRHFDRSGIAPRFPFGFGLSYTRFEQRGLELAQGEVSPNVEESPNAECPIGTGSTCPSPAKRGRAEPGTNLGHEVLPAGGSLELSVLVKNVGERAGAELVQAYVRELAPSVPRPPKELAAFAKVWLEAGEERRVALSIAPRAFQFYDEASATFRQRPGQFEVLVGPNAAEVPLRRTFLVR